MSSLFLTIVQMSVASGLTALVVMLLRFPLKKAPKIFSYALWAVVFFRLVCPFSFQSALGLIPTDSINTRIEGIAAPHSVKPGGITGIQNGELSVIAETPTVSAGNQAGRTPQTNAGQEDSSEASSAFSVTDILSFVWLSGILLLAGYGIISYIALKSRLRFATHVCGGIFECDLIRTPFLLGYIRPKIYIPASLTGTELDCVLKHEQTHLRRCDHIVKSISYLTLLIHWFNPVIWLSFYLMSRDMEMSCDESVIKHSTGDIRAAYSNSLLALSVKQGLLSPLAFGEGSVKSRIKNILNYKKPAFWAVIVILAAVVCAVFILTANPKDPEVPDSSPDISAPVSQAAPSPASPQTSVIASVYVSETLGFSLTFPAEWKGRYFVIESDNSLEVYSKLVHEDSNYEGRLFTIVRLTGDLITAEDMSQSPEPTKLLLKGNGYTYYLSMVSDVQYPPDDEELSAEYTYLSGAKIYESIALYGDQRPEAKSEGYQVVGTSFFTVEIPVYWDMRVQEDALLTWSLYDGSAYMGKIVMLALYEPNIPVEGGTHQDCYIQNDELFQYANINLQTLDEGIMEKMSGSFTFTGGYFTVVDLKTNAERYVLSGGERLFGKIDSIDMKDGLPTVINVTIMDFDYEYSTFPENIQTYTKSYPIEYTVNIAPLVAPDYTRLGTYDFPGIDERFFENYPNYQDFYYDFITDSAGTLQMIIGHYIP